MVFRLFGFRKPAVIEDVVVKESVQPAEPESIEPVSAAEQPGPPGQMETAKATREDVIAAYKIFLGRLPESMDVVVPRVGATPEALLVDFLTSKEFLSQAPKSTLVLALAKKILEERRQPESTDASALA